MSQHQIVHVEIPAEDPAASGAFYHALFGWEIQTDPASGYTRFSPGAGPGGALPQPGGLMEAGKVFINISTPDVDASLAKVAELGGTVVYPKMEIPGNGWFAIFRDPTGNLLGLYQRLEPSTDG